MSHADDGRNISVDEGAVCGLCNKFGGTGGTLGMLVLLINGDCWPLDPSD
jgi:hypothetical protein